MTDTERAAIAIQALRDVVNPLAWLRREDSGRPLSDDRILSFIRNPYTYISIARVALRALGEYIEDPRCENIGPCN